METISPRFTEYGKFKEMKNGWNTSKDFGTFIIPSPVSGLTANPVMIHEVIVSGTFLRSLYSPSSLTSATESQIQVSGNSFRIFGGGGCGGGAEGALQKARLTGAAIGIAISCGWPRPDEAAPNKPHCGKP